MLPRLAPAVASSVLLVAAVAHSLGCASLRTQVDGLLGKDPEHISAIMLHPVWMGIMTEFLSRSTLFQPLTHAGDPPKYVTSLPQLSIATGSQLSPGAIPQSLHRDETIYGYPRIEGDFFAPMLGCLIAATKSTKRNGATNVVPGSHLWPHDRIPNMEDAVSAEMDVGSALFWLGGTYHGGGTNSCEKGEEGSERRLYGVFGSPDCFRQEENQYMSLMGLHPEAIPKLSREALRVAGFGRTKGGIGWVDWQDPMEIMFPHLKNEPKPGEGEKPATAAMA